MFVSKLYAWVCICWSLYLNIKVSSWKLFVRRPRHSAAEINSIQFNYSHFKKKTKKVSCRGNFFFIIIKFGDIKALILLKYVTSLRDII